MVLRARGGTRVGQRAMTYRGCKDGASVIPQPMGKGETSRTRDISAQQRWTGPTSQWKKQTEVD